MPIESTREEVAAQPEVIGRVLKELDEQIEALAQKMVSRNINYVLASGSGDSWFAAQAVKLAWERYADVPFDPQQAYEFAAYGRPGDASQTAHFVISSSGRPTTTWDALDLAIDSGAMVIGVTDNPADTNPFVTRPPDSLIPKGSKAGWPCQTTSATIAALTSLAIAFGNAKGAIDKAKAADLKNQLKQIPAQMEKVLADSKAWANVLVDKVGIDRNFTFTGGGPSWAIAQNGSALLAAGPQTPGMPLTAEEFHHALRIGVVQQGEPVIVINPSGDTQSRGADSARVVSEWGGNLALIATPRSADLTKEEAIRIVIPEVAEPFSPLLTLMPLQVLSIVIAERKLADGYQRPKSVPQ